MRLSGIFILLSLIATGDEKHLAVLKSIDQKYSSSKTVNMEVEKSTYAAILQQRKNNKGHLFLSQGKLRLEFLEPDHSLIVLDGRDLWIANFPPENQKLPIQVAKTSANGKQKNQILVGTFLGRGKLTSQFNLKSTEFRNDQYYFKLEPKTPTPDLKSLLLVANRAHIITELTYWDELENETKFKFSNSAFNKTLAPKLFSFEMPKNAELTRY